MKRTFSLALSLCFAVNLYGQQSIPDTAKEDFKDDWAALSHYKKKTSS
ncbi:hypothetical protein [Mucilaginibacter sp. OK283]|jgi:hypothetical protein|nr:hypothetical protein [Mucilaginibacter sp. OK283]SEP41221.1 hypothetical protein SAMN05428947_11534 [Mucilaginibacter sp. OK283]